METASNGIDPGQCPLPEFFKTFRGVTVSGIGVGTWMGDLSAATDARYVETLVHAASRGLNVFDTAINSTSSSKPWTSTISTIPRKRSPDWRQKSCAGGWQ